MSTFTDPETGVIYWRDENGILRPRELTNSDGDGVEVVGYEQESGFFPDRVKDKRARVEDELVPDGLSPHADRTKIGVPNERGPDGFFA